VQAKVWNNRRDLLPIRESNSRSLVRSADTVMTIRNVDRDIDSSMDSATEGGRNFQNSFHSGPGILISGQGRNGWFLN